MLTTKPHVTEFQQELSNRINQNKKSWHNAGCPCCYKTWNFCVESAWLTQVELDEVLEKDFLYVICENCYESEYIEEAEEELEYHEVFFTWTHRDRE